ncbi:MAG: hypothetical protein ABIT76_11890 [Chthoniobacterales bacterium]
MKPIYLILTTLFLGATSLRIHSQSKPSESAGAALIQIKAANESLITRQAATLEVLKAMEADSNQLRIVAKRG